MNGFFRHERMTNSPPMTDARPLDRLACCRISRLPVAVSPRWCWADAAGRYGIRVSRIGARIISIESWGHVNLENARRGWTVFRQALADAPDAKEPFVIIDDHSGIRAASFNARAFLAQKFKRQLDWQGYITYGDASVFELALNLARRMNLFHFEIQMAADYDQAVRTAVEWQTHGVRNRVSLASNAGTDGMRPAAKTTDMDAGTPDRTRERALAVYARELFQHVSQLNLNRYGVVAVEDEHPSDHPFRAVYDALGMIHTDMERILARYQRSRLRLKRQERELLAKNAALAETQTTLEILLRERREERRKQTARADQHFADLLRPIVEGLTDQRMHAAQRRRAELLRDLIATIGGAFVPNPMIGRLKLTPREMLTAYLVARGCTTREAAAVMNTSPRTVERYRSGLRKKAGLTGTHRQLHRWLNHQDDNPSSVEPCRP